jgi:hypothetical protein
MKFGGMDLVAESRSDERLDASSVGGLWLSAEAAAAGAERIPRATHSIHFDRSG